MTITGRPSRYTAELADRACRAYELGCTDEQVAALLGVHHDTLRRWRLRHPEFDAAKTAGCELADRRVELSMYLRATGYDYTETRVLLPRGAPEPVCVPVTRHKHADVPAGFRWLALRKGAPWGGRAAPHDEHHDLADRLTAALARVAAARAADEENG